MPTPSTRSTAFARSPLRIAGWKSTIPTSMQENRAGAFTNVPLVFFELSAGKRAQRSPGEGPKEGSFMKMSSLSLLSLLGVSLFIAAGMGTVAQDQDQRRFIDQLKKTPVSEIESGLPNESFDTWFANQIQPSHAEYEVNDCGERNATLAERGKEFPTCVAVTAIAGIRKVDLAFVVGI